MSTTIGMMAGALTTGCWLPQLRRAHKTGSTDDISAGYLLIFSGGSILWILHGALESNVPVLITNALTALALSTLILAKARQRRAASRRRPLVVESRVDDEGRAAPAPGDRGE